MNHPIPEPLRNPDFRFFLVGSDSKNPIEKRWNTDNNYSFFESKLLNHVRGGGNVGVLAGIGGLLIIDFDDAAYQEEKEKLLPKTFTTRTACKGLHHLFYILDGESFQTVGVGDDPRLADLMSVGGRCVVPPSSIKGRLYSPVNDLPLATITPEQLKEVFGLSEFRKARCRRQYSTEPQPELIQKSVDALLALGVPRTSERHFKCPFHSSKGGSCLWVGLDGNLHCFHCNRHFDTAEEFVIEFERINGGIHILI